MMKYSIFQEHPHSRFVYLRFSGDLFPVVMIDGDQSSHPGMTEMGENTALPQSTTNDRVSDKICYFHMNLFTKMML